MSNETTKEGIGRKQLTVESQLGTYVVYDNEAKITICYCTKLDQAERIRDGINKQLNDEWQADYNRRYNDQLKKGRYAVMSNEITSEYVSRKQHTVGSIFGIYMVVDNEVSKVLCLCASQEDAELIRDAVNHELNKKWQADFNVKSWSK